jgi:hypothetical protein
MKFRQFDNEHVAQAWERMKSMIKNCPTHGLTTWMIIQTFYARLNFSSRNLLDSAAGGTFMSITLGAATKLLDNIMVNFFEWHTERAPQGKKVNSVEETSSLSDKIDTIMLMLANNRAHVDPNNVPLASLFAQEEHVDVNFIRNNNFNDSTYRNNFASNNYRPYPSNGDNSYLGIPKMPSEERILEVEWATKNFMQMQYEQNKLFTKTMEEQSTLLKTISHQLDILNMAIPELQAKVSKAETNISCLFDAQSSLINRMATKPDPFAATNAIQVIIDENVRMLAKLHARWEREDEMARNIKVCTIITSYNVVSNANNPLTLTGVEKTPTPCAKKPKTAKTFSTKSAEIFRSMEDNSSTSFNDFDVDGCNISEVILFLQKLALSPSASSMNVAFTKHITNALMKIRK